MKQMTEAQLRALLERAWDTGVAAQKAHDDERDVELLRDIEIEFIMDTL